MMIALVALAVLLLAAIFEGSAPVYVNPDGTTVVDENAEGAKKLLAHPGASVDEADLQKAGIDLQGNTVSKPETTSQPTEGDSIEPEGKIGVDRGLVIKSDSPTPAESAAPSGAGKTRNR
jgi:hypothetical protein